MVDPLNAWMYEMDMGVDVALDQAELLAHLVAEEMSLGEMTTLLKLRRGRYSLVEEKVEATSRVVGSTLEELHLHAACAVVAVIRGDDLLPSAPTPRLQAGDEVLAVVHADHLAELEEMLGRGGA